MSGGPARDAAGDESLGPRGALAHGREGGLDRGWWCAGAPSVRPGRRRRRVGPRGPSPASRSPSALALMGGSVAGEEALEGLLGGLAGGRRQDSPGGRVSLCPAGTSEAPQAHRPSCGTSSADGPSRKDLRPARIRGRPEAQCAVADGQAGSERQAPLLEIAQHIEPGLGGFAHAIGEQQSVRGFVDVATQAVGMAIRWEGEGVDEKAYDATSGGLYRRRGSALLPPHRGRDPGWAMPPRPASASPGSRRSASPTWSPR